jgi:hypothetical protein
MEVIGYEKKKIHLLLSDMFDEKRQINQQQLTTTNTTADNFSFIFQHSMVLFFVSDYSLKNIVFYTI